MIETPTEEQLRPVLDQCDTLAGKQYTIVSVEAFDPEQLFTVPNEMPPELFAWIALIWEVTATYSGPYGRQCKETVVVGLPKGGLQLVQCTFRDKSPSW